MSIKIKITSPMPERGYIAGLVYETEEDEGTQLLNEHKAIPVLGETVNVTIHGDKQSTYVEVPGYKTKRKSAK